MTALPSDPITLQDVRDAAARIAGRVHRTPVVTSRTLNDRAGCELFFKVEALQRCGSFKARGACNAVSLLTPKQAARGVVTDSSGNHGQALAWAAREAGVASTIVVPTDAPRVKLDAMRGYGARIVPCEPTLDERAATIARVREQTGATYVSSCGQPEIMAGQGTAVLELLDEVGPLDAVVVPVGGGGLLTGTAIAGQRVQPGLRIFAAEPAGADDAARSKAAGAHLPPEDHRSVAGGLLVGLKPLAWPTLRDRVEAVITVSDDEIVAAMRLVWERMKLVVEPSGATALAAMLQPSLRDRGLGRVGILLSGGNVDLDRLPWRDAV